MRIHPTADVASSAAVGDGTQIWHQAQVRDRVTIGTNCILGKGTYIDEDVVIGNNVKIQNRASVYKDCVIENGVFIGPHVCFTNDVLPRAITVDGKLKGADDWTPGKTTVQYGASIGAGSTILPGRTIGRFALVGAGTVLTHDVPPFGLVVGNPGRLVGYACMCGARLIEQGQELRCSHCTCQYMRDDTGIVTALTANDRRAAVSNDNHIHNKTTHQNGRTEDVKPTVAVVGLGKVGLPLAVQYASRGARVIGCDINPAVVQSVNQGVSPIGEETDLAEKLADVHRRGLLHATTETVEAVRTADVVVVIVPMMVDEDRAIDFRAIDSATRAIGLGLRPGTLVVYETTLPVGTTRSRFGTMLGQASGLEAGDDYFLAFSPERIRTGRIFRDLATYPKIVGGVNAESTARAGAFYRAVLEAPVTEVSSAEAAELTKLMETAFRDVNIALANEFAMYAAARNINMREAMDAANSQPQSMIHDPGVGVGGHCIPVYPYFLMQDAEPGELQLSRTSRAINDDMAAHAASMLAAEIGDLRGRDVLIMGLAYRADVKEYAFSSALLLQRELVDRGAVVTMHDPLFAPSEIEAAGGRPASLDQVGNVDAIIIQANHAAYRDLPASFFRKARVVLDGRGDAALATMDLGETTLVQVGAPPVKGKGSLLDSVAV